MAFPACCRICWRASEAVSTAKSVSTTRAAGRQVFAADLQIADGGLQARGLGAQHGALAAHIVQRAVHRHDGLCGRHRDVQRVAQAQRTQADHAHPCLQRLVGVGADLEHLGAHGPGVLGNRFVRLGEPLQHILAGAAAHVGNGGFGIARGAAVHIQPTDRPRVVVVQVKGADERGAVGGELAFDIGRVGKHAVRGIGDGGVEGGARVGVHVGQHVLDPCAPAALMRSCM